MKIEFIISAILSLMFFSSIAQEIEKEAFVAIEMESTLK